VPIENKPYLLEVPGEVLGAIDPIFYADALTAALKACGLR